MDATELLLRHDLSHPTYLRMYCDRERASERLKPLLETIARRLFDPDFNVSALWREHGIHDRTASARFRELRTTPNAYITRLRLDVAERFLHQSHLPVRRIARLCGYANQTTFGRAFKKRFGQPPDEYRRAVEAGERLPYLEDWIRRGLRKELDPDDGADLVYELGVLQAGLQLWYKKPEGETASTSREPETAAETRPETDGASVH